VKPLMCYIESMQLNVIGSVTCRALTLIC